MTATYGGHPGELSDAELTAILLAADDELIDHVRASVDPTVTLLSIMEGRRSHPSVRKNSSDPVAVSMRSIAHALQCELNMSIERADALVRGIERADGRAHMLVTALGGVQIRDSHLVHSFANALYHELVLSSDRLGRDLMAARDAAMDLMEQAAIYADEVHASVAEFTEAIGRALSGIEELGSLLARSYVLANDLGLEIARSHAIAEDVVDSALFGARKLAQDYGNARTRIRGIAADLHLCTILNPARELAWIQVNASDTDLSAVPLPDLDVLMGVLWTVGTSWPSDVAERVLAWSREVRPGVYQVRGNGLDLSDLAKVSPAGPC